MLKNILKLDGAQELSKSEQKSINGGVATEHCQPGYCKLDAVVECAYRSCVKITAITAPQCVCY